MPIAA